MNDVKRTFHKLAAEMLREAYEAGDLVPNDGPVAESSTLMHEYEQYAERFIDELETRGGR